MEQLLYENFVREAFAKALKKSIGRGGDPASLAEADYFTAAYSKEYLNRIKVGTAYAIAINNSICTETKNLKGPEDYRKMDEFLDRALNAQNSDDINAIIKEYIKFEGTMNNINY